MTKPELKQVSQVSLFENLSFYLGWLLTMFVMLAAC